METVSIDGISLTLAQVVQVAYRRSQAKLDPSARARMTRSRQALERILTNRGIVYGVNTGFGKLKDVPIPADKLETLQVNLVRSHCTGLGDLFPEEVVRAVMLLRANTLAHGAPAVRPELVETLLEMLRQDLLPEIPAQGSVSASGDLAPLSHLALAMMGEGYVRYHGERTVSGEALRRAGIPPLRYAPKEGLSLINGTQVTTGIGCLAAHRAGDLLAHADIATSMTVEALRCTWAAYDERIQRMRPHPGQAETASNLRRLLKDSGILKSHQDCDRIQDSYALRCVPQVHGAVRDTLRHVRSVLQIELNSVTDNPVLAPDEEQFLMGGNFHAAPIGFVMDFLGIAMTDLSSISERRLERLMNPALSGLPAFLAADPGLQSGFMLAHVTAASLVSENKVFAHPASVDTIPTSGGQEDHVSMGTWAARKATTILDNTEWVIAIEILAACQGLDFLLPLRPGEAVDAGRSLIRNRIPRLTQDRVLSGDIEEVRALIRSGELRRQVEAVSGPLVG